MSKTANKHVQLSVVSIPIGKVPSAVSTLRPGPRGHAVPKNMWCKLQTKCREELLSER